MELREYLDLLEPAAVASKAAGQVFRPASYTAATQVKTRTGVVTSPGQAAAIVNAAERFRSSGAPLPSGSSSSGGATTSPSFTLPDTLPTMPMPGSGGGSSASPSTSESGSGSGGSTLTEEQFCAAFPDHPECPKKSNTLMWLGVFVGAALVWRWVR